MGNRIYGCDDCLAVCPWNKFAQQGREAKLAARDVARAPALAELARLDDAAFRAMFAKTAVKRTGRDRFIRNVLIAIGNSGDRIAGAAGRAAAVRRIAAGSRRRGVGARRDSIPRGSPRSRRRHAGETDPAVAEEWAAARGDGVIGSASIKSHTRGRNVMAHLRTHAPHHACRTCRGCRAAARARFRRLAGAQHFHDPRPDRRRRRRRQRAGDRRRPVAEARPADRGRTEARRGRHAGRGADSARHARRLSAAMDSQRIRRLRGILQVAAVSVRSTISPSSVRRSSFRS